MIEMSVLQKDYDALKRLQESTVLAVDTLSSGMKELQSENIFLKTQLQSADKNIGIQKQIVINHINQSQKVHDGLVEEIMDLKETIRLLR